MSWRTIALAAACLLVAGGGFLLGGLIADDDPAPNGSVPTEITTGSSSAPIPTLSNVEQIPALDLPPETASEASGETSAPEAESPPVVESEEAPPSSSSPSPEVTVAPTE